MSKTFKLSIIFLTTVVNLVLSRLVFSFVELSDNLSSWLFSSVFQIIFMGVVPYLLYRFWVSKDGGEYLFDMRLEKRISPWSYPLAILIGALVFIINTAFSSVWYVFLNFVGYTYVSSVGTIYSSPEVLAMEILVTCMLPAFFEELTDRGLLLAVLDKSPMKDGLKIAIVGIFFGFLHQNVTQFAPTIFGGLVMAFMAVKCRSIFPTIIVHFINNFVITMYDYSDQTGGFFGQIYNYVYGAVTSNYFIYLGVLAVSLILLFVLLRVFSMVNHKYRKLSLVPIKKAKKVASLPEKEPQQPVAAEEGVYVRQNDEYFNNVVMPKLNPKYLAAIQNPDDGQARATKTEGKKVGWWHYGMIAVALLLAAASTAVTFYWGLIR